MSWKNSLFKSICFYFFAIALFFLCCNPHSLFNKTLFYIFQGRDIDRALKILSGHAIFYGPEMTGGGYLPGPLYYLFLSVALFFKANWVSAWVMQYTLAFLGAVAGIVFFEKYFSRSIALLWVILFGMARFTGFYLVLFLNVSSMLVFTILTLILINKIFTGESEKGREKSYFFMCLVVGLGLQFHLSLICLFLAQFFMQLFSKKLKLLSISRKSTWIGFVILILPSVPYIIWQTLSHLKIIVGEPGFYNGETDQALTSILHLMKLGMLTSWSTLLTLWINKILFTIPLTLIAIFLAHFFSKKVEQTSSDTKAQINFRVIAICLMFSFVPYFNWYLSPQGMRYSMSFYLSIIFLTLFAFNSIVKSPAKIWRFNLFALLIDLIIMKDVFAKGSRERLFRYGENVLEILVVFILAFYLFEKKEYKKRKDLIVSFILFIVLVSGQRVFLRYTTDSEDYMPSAREWQLTWQDIYSYTGWNYEEAKKRIYYIGHHVNQDPKLFLEGNTLDQLDSENKLKDIPDGFFVSNRYDPTPKRGRENKFSPNEWLLNQGLQPSIANGIKSGAIKVGENLSSEILLLPYWVTDKQKLPAHFHNTGEGYHLSEDDLRLAEIKGHNGVKKINSNEFLFKWNESPDQNAYCSTGAFVQVEKKSAQTYKLNLKVIGGTISQISPWVSPNWTQAWISPYIEVSCDDTVKKFLISDSIGFRRDFSHQKWTPFFSGNNSLVAPFEKSFEINCKRPIKFLKLGREGSLVEKIRSVERLSATSLSYELDG